MLCRLHTVTILYTVLHCTQCVKLYIKMVNLHRAEKIYTGAACGACNKYQVWILQDILGPILLAPKLTRFCIFASSFFLQKVRLPFKVLQYEEECKHEHLNERRKTGEGGHTAKKRFLTFFFFTLGLNPHTLTWTKITQGIWVPKLVFSNTEQKINTQNDEEAFAVAR